MASRAVAGGYSGYPVAPPMNTPSSLPHLRRIADVDDQAIADLFEAASAIAAAPGQLSRHPGRIVATLFYEPSTRTRLSFESASLRLGAHTIGFADPGMASVAKGEALIDTIRTVQRFADAIVLRHPSEGAAMLASKVALVPIINAGDGGHEHPTQTLCDLYTIHQRFGSLQGRRIGFTGDLLYGRTVHSLAALAARFGAKLTFIAPAELQLPAHLRDRFASKTELEFARDLDTVVHTLDVLYVTRLQEERIDPSVRSKLPIAQPITRARLRGAKPELLLMHPLPRVREISFDVDEDARSLYFEQLANGLILRMAILDRIFQLAQPISLGAFETPPKLADPPWRRDDRLVRCPNPKCISNTERQVASRSEDGTHCVYCDHPLKAVT